MAYATLLAFVLSLQVSPPIQVSAQQAPPPAPVPSITDAVFVSASLVELPLSRVTDSVALITPAELRARQIETVAGALRSLTGLGVTSSGGRGSVTSIFTRGGESDYTLVLVDGIPLNEFGGAIDLAHLTAAGIDRIEVVRGPQGALHGAGAIAGVVQIVSASGGPASASAHLEGGSETFVRGGADVRGAARGLNLGGGADIMSTDGAVDNDQYRRTELSGVIARGFGRDARVRATARWNDHERGFPGPYGSNPAGNFTGIDTVSRGENTAVTAGAAFDLARGAVTHRVTGSFMRRDGSFISIFSPDDPSESSSERASARYALDWTQSPRAGVTAGAEIAAESAGSTFIDQPIERTIAGYFAEARLIGGSRLLATAGGRIDQIRHDGNTVTAFNPRVSARIYLTSPSAENVTSLRGGYASGIKPPSAFELSSTDNPSLKPERNRSVEAAIEQTLMRGTVQLSATAFWNRYDDLIITVGRSLAGVSQYRSDNLSNSRARGWELAAAFRTGAGLSLRGGYTWLHTEILAADGVAETGLAPFVVGDRLLRRPRNRGFADVTFTRGNGSAFFALDARGRTLDVEPSFGLFGGLYDNDGYVTSSAGASWTFARRVTLFARVTNLFDRDYEEIFGFPAPSRRVAGGIRIAASR